MMKRLLFLMTSVVVLLSGCKDDDSFSSDHSLRLAFSVDTVRVDTVFTTVPSATYSFWVRNQSGNGIRINSVRLERGNQSGFRANVDGVFVNPVATDLEVRKGDSLRVFVELTALENRSEEPHLVEDNLLFLLESGVEQRVNLRAISLDAQKMSNLVVNSDMTIESSLPVVFYGEGIKVEEGATLTLRNTKLYFHDGAGLQVKGRVVAENCLFRGDRLDHMFDYLPYDRVSGQWAGITIKSRADGCTFTDCEIRSAYNGIMADSTIISMTNTIVHNSKGYCLYAHDSEVTLQNCLLSNALNDCLSLYGCQAIVAHSTLAQFYPFSAARGAALRFGPSDDYPVKLEFSNTMVTGYEEDVLMGEERNDETVDYIFQNCLLRTPVVDDADAFDAIIWEKTSDAVQGTGHFVTIDETNFIYDFQLKEESPCVELGIGWTN